MKALHPRTAWLPLSKTSIKSVCFSSAAEPSGVHSEKLTVLLAILPLSGGFNLDYLSSALMVL